MEPREPNVIVESSAQSQDFYPRQAFACWACGEPVTALDTACKRCGKPQSAEIRAREETRIRSGCLLFVIAPLLFVAILMATAGNLSLTTGFMVMALIALTVKLLINFLRSPS